MSRAKRIAWRDVERDNPLPLVQRQRIVGSQAMLSRFELGKGCNVPSHQHENEQFAYVLSGRVRFVVGEDAEEVVLTGGEVLHLPSMVSHSAEALEDSVVLDVFAPPSESTGVDE